MTVERWRLPSVDLRHAEQHLAQQSAIEGQRQAESVGHWWREYGGVIGFVLAGLVVGSVFSIGIFGFAVVLACLIAWQPAA